MLGVGATELIIILVIAVMLFGLPAIIGFWLGYNAGKKSASDDQDQQTNVPPPTDEESHNG